MNLLLTLFGTKVLIQNYSPLLPSMQVLLKTEICLEKSKKSSTILQIQNYYRVWIDFITCFEEQCESPDSNTSVPTVGTFVLDVQTCLLLQITTRIQKEKQVKGILVRHLSPWK